MIHPKPGACCSRKVIKQRQFFAGPAGGSKRFVRDGKWNPTCTLWRVPDGSLVTISMIPNASITGSDGREQRRKSGYLPQLCPIPHPAVPRGKTQIASVDEWPTI